MKRVFLLIATNLAIMLILSISVSVLGLNRFITQNGLNLSTLLLFSAVFGFGGAFISLWISKPIAKWSAGVQVITQAQNQTESWLLSTIERLSKKAGISMPEVGVYEGAPNAFATGASRNSALVAVSHGLLSGMTKEEVEAVLAHEIAHIKNGDMVTLTLIQGVVNTFVIFLARIVAFAVDNFLRKDNDNSGPGMAYYITSFVCELLFGLAASVIVLYYSRKREYRADAGAAELLGQPHTMIAALRRLGNLSVEPLPQNLASSGIAGGSSWSTWFMTHPSLESRIEALSQYR